MSLRWIPFAASAAFVACGSTAKTPGGGGASAAASSNGASSASGGSAGRTGDGSSATGSSATGSAPGSSATGSAAGTSATGSSATGGASRGDGGGLGSEGGADADASGDAGAIHVDAGASWTCPSGLVGKVPALASAVPARVAGVPPADLDGGINGMGYGFSTIEGPVWVGDALLVSEFGTTMPPPSRILQIAPGGAVRIAGPAGWNPGTNGLAVDLHGTVYGAVHLDGSISRFDVASGQRTPIVSTYNGARFNSPNDLAIRSDGTIYFSDPAGFQSPSPTPQSQPRVYRIPPGASAASVVDPLPGVQPLNQPNGVTLSLDENTLYVSSNSAVYAFPVMADGTTGARPATPWSTLNIDGMVIDCAGNVYGAVIQTNTIHVFGPTGASLGTITVPGIGAVTNVAFGGADHKTLYITGQGQGGGQQPPSASSQGLYAVTLDIPGKPY